MPKVTHADERILRFISEYEDEHGFSPTIREICQGTGIQSTSTVHRNMMCLLKKGSLVQAKPGSARSVLINHAVMATDEPIHLCLQTADGGTIILNCISVDGKVVFMGQMSATGFHNGITKVIACHELDDDSYYDAMIG